MTDSLARKDRLTDFLNRYTSSRVPGLQYVVVDAKATQFAYTGGWADIQNQAAMTPAATLMAYSMTKTFTAIAILQLVEKGRLNLSDEMDLYLPDTPYGGHHITLRHMLAHTAGFPAPIPLRWAHLAEENATFNEDAALAQVLADNPRLAFEPGQKFGYSNIGYWLLGKIVERVSGQRYPDYVCTHILLPLGLSAQEIGFTIPSAARHANGYLAKYTLMNLLKGFVTDSKFWAGYEGHWLRLRSHYLNGPAFGGLLGTARSFSAFLQDQLRAESCLFKPQTRQLLETPQTTDAGKPVPMTLGWHVGETQGERYLFKEGGGAGFHSEMRIYRGQNRASLVMVNCTGFNSRRFLNRVDSALLGP